MGGGLMQLVAYGAQDIYLTGNPQITFLKLCIADTLTSLWKKSLKPHQVEKSWVQSTCTISRNGDLVHKMYVQYSEPAGYDNATGSFGHSILKEIECEIGGQKIDKHYGHWLEVWSNLTEPNSVGSTPVANKIGGGVEAAAAYGPTKYQRMAGIRSSEWYNW